MIPVKTFAADDMRSGNALLRHCTAALSNDGSTNMTDAFMRGRCFGVMAGILDTVAVYTELIKPPLFCPPAEGTIEQATRVVLKYLQDHPEELHNNGVQLSIAAFIKAFPCKNSK